MITAIVVMLTERFFPDKLVFSCVAYVFACMYDILLLKILVKIAF